MVWPLIVHQVITKGKAGGGGAWVAVFRMVVGAGVVWIAGRPSARPGVHRVFGQVFSFCPDVFTFRPDVFSLRRNVSTFPPFAQNVSTRTAYVSTRSLDGGLELSRPGARANAARLGLQKRLRNPGVGARKTPCMFPGEGNSEPC